MKQHEFEQRKNLSKKEKEEILKLVEKIFGPECSENIPEEGKFKLSVKMYDGELTGKFKIKPGKKGEKGSHENHEKEKGGKGREEKNDVIEAQEGEGEKKETPKKKTGKTKGGKEASKKSAEKYDDLKKRMNMTWKHITQHTSRGELPDESDVVEFMQDADHMVEYPDKGDELYEEFSKDIEMLRKAWAKRDTEEFIKAVEMINSCKKEAHKRFA